MNPNRLSFDQETSKIAVQFGGPEFAAYLTAVKKIPTAKFDAELRMWWIDQTQLRAVLSTFPTFPKSATIEALEAQVKANDLAGSAAFQRAIQVNFDGPIGSRTLMAHQKVVPARFLSQKFLLLADDMGLGKSFSALVSAKALGIPVVVLAPVSVHGVWRWEAAEVGVKIDLRSWAKVGVPPTGAYCLVADECHMAQNMTSKRTKAFLAVAAEAQAVLCLTGTPMKNGKPINLFPLLKALRHPLSINKKLYEMEFCGAQKKTIGPGISFWDTTGATNLLKLHELTKQLVLRRTKEECLDLPTKTRILVEVEMDSATKAIYDTTYTMIRAEWERRRGTLEFAEALRMLLAYRQSASTAKIPATLERAQDLLENGHQVVLFTAFESTANTIRNLISQVAPTGLITGSVPVPEREKAVAAFQRGDLRVMVATIGAGGVGITLTAADNVILVDRPWTPGDALQAEDRIYRIGQTRKVMAHWMELDGTDRAIDAALLKKQLNISLMLEGKAETIEFDNQKQAVFSLLEKAFSV